MTEINVVFENISNRFIAETAPGFDSAMQNVKILPNNNPVLVMQYCGPCEFSKSCSLKLLYDRYLKEIRVKGICLKK